MTSILFWIIFLNSQKTYKNLEEVYYFEYTYENYESIYDLINLKELNIYTNEKNSRRNCCKLYSKKLTLDGINNNQTVVDIQGFISKNMYDVLKKENYVNLSLIYEQPENFIERKMLYEINDNGDGLIFTKGQEDFIERITMKNLENLLKFSGVIKENDELIEKCKLLEKLYDYLKSSNKHEDYLSSLINEWDCETTPYNYEGYIILRTKMFYFSINCFNFWLIKSMSLLNSKRKNFIELNWDDFVEHSFAIQKKNIFITRSANLSYNLNSERFKGEYKDLIEEKNYKLFKNTVLFPIKSKDIKQ